MNQLIARNSLLPNINIKTSSLLLLNMKVCVLMYLYQMLQQFIHSPLIVANNIYLNLSLPLVVKYFKNILLVCPLLDAENWKV